jgi:signal peptidase II
MEKRTKVEEPTSEVQGSRDAKSQWTWQRDWILFATIAAVFAADQLTKFAIKGTLRLGESWPAEGLIRITHGSNTGTAFGLLPNQTLFLIFASIIAIGFLIYFYRAYALPRPILRLAIGLQLGGAFGNLFDRVAYGAVTDFIDVGWWPIFNIADSSICVGMATLVIVLLLFDSRKEMTSEAEPAQGDTSGSVDTRS